MADHNCLTGPRSKCPACIEDTAHESARMRRTPDWEQYMGEAVLILEGIELHHQGTSE